MLLAHAGEQAARLARAEAAAAGQEEKAEKRRAKKARQRAARAQPSAQQGPDQSKVPHFLFKHCLGYSSCDFALQLPTVRGRLAWYSKLQCVCVFISQSKRVAWLDAATMAYDEEHTLDKLVNL